MQTLKELIVSPWPWYVAGPLMGLTIPLLLFFGNKMLGASSSLRHIMAIVPNRLPYFQYDVKKEYWNIWFATGVLLGAFITYHLIHDPLNVDIAASTREDLIKLGLTDLSGLMPSELLHHTIY